MKNKTLKTLLPIGIATLVFLALLWVATLYDLQISEAIASLNDKKYISSNLFGRFFETFGEDPVYIISAIGLCFVFYALPKFIKNEKLLLTAKILLVIVIVGDYSYMAKKIIGYLSEHYESITLDGVKKYAVSVVFGLVFTAITLILTSKVKDEKITGLCVWGVIVALTFALSQGVVQGIKPFVGRMRYRAIYVLNENGLSDLAKFTKWYVWNGKGTLTEEMLNLGLGKDVFKSFPSGHTCGGAMVFTLAFLPEFLGFSEDKLKKFTVIIWTLATAFTVVLAYSRILMGAHYLSDVLFGGYIAFISAMISKKIVKTLAKKFNIL